MLMDFLFLPIVHYSGASVSIRALHLSIFSAFTVSLAPYFHLGRV